MRDIVELNSVTLMLTRIITLNPSFGSHISLVGLNQALKGLACILLRQAVVWILISGNLKYAGNFFALVALAQDIQVNEKPIFSCTI